VQAQTGERAEETEEHEMSQAAAVALKNPEIAAVDAQRKPITPHEGNILQGYLGGSLKDLRIELKKLSDANEADREQAMKKAKGSGANVSEDDYMFSDWKPGADYESKDG